ERPCDLEPLASGRAEAASRRAAERTESDRIDHGAGARPRVDGARGAQECADHDVLEHAHVLECQRNLEGAGEAEARALLGREAGDGAALEQDRAGRRREIAGEAIEQGRLSGPVWADQPEDLARSDRDGRTIDRLEAAERPGDVARLDQHGRPPLMSFRWAARRAGAATRATRRRAARPGGTARLA